MSYAGGGGWLRVPGDWRIVAGKGMTAGFIGIRFRVYGLVKGLVGSSCVRVRTRSPDSCVGMLRNTRAICTNNTRL